VATHGQRTVQLEIREHLGRGRAERLILKDSCLDPRFRVGRTQRRYGR
jgi:hypothetical protein